MNVRNKNIVWWMKVTAASLVVGTFFYLLHIPGGWLVGALIGALILSVLTPQHSQVSSKWIIASQAVLGSFMAGRIDSQSLAVAGHFLLPMAAVVLVTMSVSIGLSFVLSRVTSISKTTAVLGSLPGGASMMVAISADAENADPRIVSFMQYLRLTIVILVTAALAHFVVHTGHHVVTGSSQPFFSFSDLSSHWMNYLITPFLAFFGAWGGRKIKLPGGAILGPLILCISVKSFHLIDPLLVPGFLPAAYIIMGMYVGTLFDRESLRYAGKVAPAMAAITIIIIGVCALSGWMLSQTAHVSLLSGYLATTPGGMDSVAALAIASDSNLSFVLAVQLMRMLAILIAGPVLARVFRSKNDIEDTESAFD